MTNKIFRAVFGSVTVALLLSAGAFFGISCGRMTDMSRQELRSEIRLVSQGVENEGLSYLKDLRPGHLRITMIRKDGTVFYDSQDKNTADMENHRNRKEVREALKKGYGESQRYSDTLMERMLYEAVRLKDGSVLRLSVSQDSILALTVRQLQPAAGILILLVAASYFLSVLLSRKIVEPLNRLDLNHPLENEQYDELSPLLRRISSQQGEIRIQKNAISRKQNELDIILNHMSEGIILLDREGKIVSINAAAEKILDLQCVMPGMKLISVSRNLYLMDLVDQALNGETIEKILEIHSGQYRVNAVPILEDDAVLGLSVMLYDVTDTTLAEQMRHEFTANVSHELKTPLQSISGYAELLKNHMVRPENTDAVAGKIYQEAQRMSQLIEDIISLSHLDEGTEDLDWEWTDLAEISRKTVKELQQAADEKNISIQITGAKHAPMSGKSVLLGTIVHNLCDNAIKYGKKGGHVQVDIEENEGDLRGRAKGLSCGAGTVTLCVSDDGIGIPKGDQKRIFERFYRVDKSHSRAIGGTGLGLSIVRHAVFIHHGRIEVNSKPGLGSQFTVIFPKKQLELHTIRAV